MTKEYDITCILEGQLDPVSLHKILFALVANNCKYDAGRYDGHYNIIIEDNSGGSHFEESEEGEQTEKLAEIVREYSSYDLSEAILTVTLAETSAEPVDFNISFWNRDDDTYVVKFHSNTDDAGDEERFRRVVELVEALCHKLHVRYAAFTHEYEGFSAPERREIAAIKIGRVTYLSPEYASVVGRRNLHSLPTAETRFYDDGGVFLLVTPSPDGDYERLERAREMLDDL